MKSIKARFNKIREKDRIHSDYICFVQAIRGQGFERRQIREWFNQLVDKDDYAKENKQDIINELVEVSKTP